MVHFLLNACGRTLLLLNTVLQLILFITQRGELFLELSTVAKQVDQLLVVLSVFRFSFK